MKQPYHVTQPRSVIARLIVLKQLIRAGHSIGYMAERLGVSRKTVQRDLDFVRDELGWKVFWADISAQGRRTAPDGVKWKLMEEPKPLL